MLIELWTTAKDKGQPQTKSGHRPAIRLIASDVKRINRLSVCVLKQFFNATKELMAVTVDLMTQSRGRRTDGQWLCAWNNPILKDHYYCYSNWRWFPFHVSLTQFNAFFIGYKF